MATQSIPSMNFPAIRAYNKALEIRFAGFAQFCDADRQFDAGEWSDAAHGHAAEEMEEQTRAHVAARFGISPDELYNEHRTWCEESLPWGRTGVPK